MASPKPSKRPRIMMVAPLYHSERGGLGKQAKLLTEELANRGHKVAVITRKMIGLPPISYHPQVPILKVENPAPKLHNYDQATIKTFATSMAFSLGLVHKLIEHQRSYDIVHFHGASLPLIVALPVLKLLGKKVVALVAGTDQGFEAGDLSRHYGPLGPFLCHWLSHVHCYIALSPQIETALQRERYRPDQICRIPNLIRSDVYKPIPAEQKQFLRASLGLGPDLRVGISVGRLVKLKGLDVLLRALSLIKQRVRNWHWLILGDGPERPALEALTKELDLQNHVTFIGFQKDVENYLALSDLYCIPSYREGLPNSLLEAMSAGLPSIASDLGGCQAALTPECGHLFTAGDHQMLASILSLSLIDTFQRQLMGQAARERILKHFSMDSIVARTEALYQSVWNNTERPAPFHEFAFQGTPGCSPTATTLEL